MAQDRSSRNRLFADGSSTTALGVKTVRGGAVTVASQGLQLVLGMAGTVVLARLLDPTDYGFVSMSAVVIGFASIFKDAGLSEATVQRATITHKQASTLLWLNVGLGAFLMLAVAAAAPAVAWFYGTPPLTPITVAFAVGFPVGALGVQHAALLRRQMRFGVLAGAELASAFVGLVVTVVLAWRGARYWSLVVGRLAESLSFTVGAWLVSGWRPGLPSRGSGVRSMLAFGGNLTGFSMINYFARNVDNLLIGKYWGAEQLGLYSRAYQLLLLPIRQLNSPIGAVAVPALSRLADNPERYREAYSRILEKIAIVTMPGAAFAIVTSDWLVRVALGPRWSEVGPLFALLAVSAFVQSLANTTGWLFVSQDRTRDLLRWGMIGANLTTLGIVIGLPRGATGVAASYSITFLCLTTPLLFWFVGRKGPVGPWEFYRIAAPAFFAAMAVLGVLIVLRRSLGGVHPVLALGLSLACTILVTGAVLSSSVRGRRAMRDLLLAAKSLIPHASNEAEPNRGE